MNYEDADLKRQSLSDLRISRSMFYFPCPIYATMKPLQTLVLLLALSEILLAHPILPQPDTDRPPSPWKKYLPTIGAIGIIGSLFALVTLGTMHNEAYDAVDSIDRLKSNPRLAALPQADRAYLVDGRIEYIGREKDLNEEEREEIQVSDFLHGFPMSSEMPDTTGMGRSAIKKLLAVHTKVAKAEQKLKEAKQSFDRAKGEEVENRYNAGEIIATDWKEVVERAEKQVRDRWKTSVS